MHLTIWGMFAAGSAYVTNLFSFSSTNDNQLHERIDTLEKEKQQLEQKNRLLEIENKVSIKRETIPLGAYIKNSKTGVKSKVNIKNCELFE